MKRYMRRALSEPSASPPRELSLNALDVSGLGISCLSGLPPEVLNTMHVLDASNNDKLVNFCGLSLAPQLLVLDVRSCGRITTFAGASLQPRLVHLLLKGTPLALHPHVRVMAVLAFGPTVKSVDDAAVTAGDYERASKLGGSGSHAAMCVALGLTSLDTPKAPSASFAVGRPNAVAMGSAVEEHFRQLSLVLQQRYLHDVRENVDRLHTLDAVMRRLHPTPSRGTPWMFPTSRWRVVTESDLKPPDVDVTQSIAAVQSELIVPVAVPSPSRRTSVDESSGIAQNLISASPPAAAHHAEMNEWVHAQWQRVVAAGSHSPTLQRVGRRGGPVSAEDGSHLSVSTVSATHKLTLGHAAAHLSKSSMSLDVRSHRGHKEGLTTAAVMMTSPTLKHLLPLASPRVPSQPTPVASTTFDDLSIVLRRDDSSLPTTMQLAHGETLVEDVVLRIVQSTRGTSSSASSMSDRELHFLKPHRHALIPAAAAKPTELFVVSRDDVDDVQIVPAAPAAANDSQTGPSPFAHAAKVVLWMKVPAHANAPQWSSVVVVPMVSGAPAQQGKGHESARAQQLFSSLLAWCCSDAELSLLCI